MAARKCPLCGMTLDTDGAPSLRVRAREHFAIAHSGACSNAELKKWYAFYDNLPKLRGKPIW